MNDHPNDEQLIAYAGNDLARADATPVADYIMSFVRCTGALARYRLVCDFARANDAVGPAFAAIAVGHEGRPRRGTGPDHQG